MRFRCGMDHVLLTSANGKSGAIPRATAVAAEETLIASMFERSWPNQPYTAS